MKLFKVIYGFLLKRSLKNILEGRVKERERPEWGRFLASDIKQILRNSRERFDKIINEQNPDYYPTRGNRHNVYLAALTLAVYQALRAFGIEKLYAIELVSDAGWKLYSRFISIPRFIARLLTRNPQKQMNLILRILMVFPFSAPGRPGYEVEVRDERDRFGTFWTFCPPLHFVRSYLEHHRDSGELELFQKTWCRYDWAFSSLMMEKTTGAEGYYERTHTMSEGDELCDMYWYARAPRGEPDQELEIKKTESIGI